MRTTRGNLKTDNQKAPKELVNVTDESIASDGHIRRQLRRHSLRTAAFAAIGSTIIGSLITVTSLALFFGGDYTPADFVTLWLIYIVYSGAVVLPLAMFIGFPLMLLLHTQPSWVWIICSTAIGIILGTCALLAVSHSIRLPALLLFAVYAIAFGALAALFRQRFKTFPKKRANEPVEQPS